MTYNYGSKRKFASSSGDNNQSDDIEKALERVEQEHNFTSRSIVPRYLGPMEYELTPAQRKIYDSIVKTRSTGFRAGPFGPWLACPDIANPAQELGRVCRYGTSLSWYESELVILFTGAVHKSHSEFDIHVKEAIKAGIPIEVIKAIPRDDQFTKRAVTDRVVPLLRTAENPARAVAIATFTSELLETSMVSDETYRKTLEALDGKQSTLVEITSIVGYYTFVAYTLNVFRIPSKL